MTYSGLGKELEKFASPGSKVGLSNTFGGEFLYIEDRTLIQSIFAVDRIRNPGRYVYVNIGIEPDMTPDRFIELSEELLETSRRYDTDANITNVYYVIDNVTLRKHFLREKIAYVCEYLFKTKLIVKMPMNQRLAQYYSKIPIDYCLDIRQDSLSGDYTKAISTLRLNIQNLMEDPHSPDSRLQLVLVPPKFHLVLRVLIATSGADVVYPSGEFIDGIVARNYAAANYYYELSRAADRSKHKKGSAYAYSNIAMRYILNDREIDAERHMKTARMFVARGPWKIEEYSDIMPTDRGKQAKAEISKIYSLADKIITRIGKYRARLVGSMASYYKDTVPGDIDIIVVAGDEMQFKTIISDLVSYLHGAELETDDPKKIAKLNAMGVHVDIFAVPSLNSMEAHSRILSSTELRYYRGLAKSQGMFLGDSYLEVHPGHRIREISQALRHLGIYEYPLDIRDFRNWYYGLTSH